MELIIFAVFAFGAYQVWKKETFFGARRQWVKLLIYLPVSGIAAIAFLIEALLRGKNTEKAKAQTIASKDEPDASAAPREVEDNPAEGVFQMRAFPYATYEAWRTAYRKAASEANEGLKIQKADNGKEWSLIDLMDDAPLRSAYAHHLDPVPLGTYFGKTFDITKMQP